MTKEEKKERRALRLKLYAAVERNLPLRLKLCSTVRQIRAYSRAVADQILAGKNPHMVQVIQ